MYSNRFSGHTFMNNLPCGSNSAGHHVSHIPMTLQIYRGALKVNTNKKCFSGGRRAAVTVDIDRNDVL